MGMRKTYGALDVKYRRSKEAERGAKDNWR